MKKLITLILLLITLIAPLNTNAVSAPSPSLKSLYHFQPEIEFDFLDQKLTNLDLQYWEPYKILEEEMPSINWKEDYTIDESLILYLKEEYETIEMSFPLLYNDQEDLVYGIFITEDEHTFIRQGTVTEIGTVIFYMSYIDNTTIMYIVSNHKAG